jgi:hypothetical protein
MTPRTIILAWVAVIFFIVGLTFTTYAYTPAVIESFLSPNYLVFVFLGLYLFAVLAAAILFILDKRKLGK